MSITRSRQTTHTCSGERSPRQGLFPIVVSLIAAVILCATLAAASMAAHAVKDPATIACPAAPAGWTHSPVIKDLATPQSVPEPAAEEHLATGGNLVSVSCTYFATDIRQATIKVSYALPTDINPVNDFYFGCSSGGLNWNSTYRVYRVLSPDQWAMALFTDLGGYVDANDVPAFESATRQLLQNAEGYGHACNTQAKQTVLASRYSFDVRVANGNLTSVFYTLDNPGSNGVVKVIDSTATKTALKVRVKGTTYPLTINLLRGIDFRETPTHTADTVRYAIQVVSTKVPGCHKNAAGILTLSNSPAVLLEVCGQTFLRGQAPRRIRFFP